MSNVAELHSSVTTALAGWRGEGASAVELRYSLKAHLESELRAAGLEAAATRVESPPSSEFCDLRVGTTIGIRIFHEFTTATARQLRLLGWRGNLPYDYLLFYGFDLPDRHGDAWRIAETRLTTTDTGTPGIQRITFVRNDAGSNAPEQDSCTLWYYAEPVIGLSALLAGAVVVIVLQLDQGSGTVVLAALVTVLVSLLLLATFGLVRSGPA